MVYIKYFVSLAGHRAFENVISFEKPFWAIMDKDIINGHGRNVNDKFGWSKINHNSHFEA